MIVFLEGKYLNVCLQTAVHDIDTWLPSLMIHLQLNLVYLNTDFNVKEMSWMAAVAPRKSSHFLPLAVKWILSHILKTNLQQSVTHQRRSGKQTLLLMDGIVQAGDCEMLGGYNGPDNQPAECPSFFSLQGLLGETEWWSLLMLHELTHS